MRRLNGDGKGSDQSSGDLENAMVLDLPTTATFNEPAASVTERVDVQDLKDLQQGSNIVDWDGPSDGLNPRNWSPSRKWTTIGIISALTFNL